ncbi:MAG: hypothetical protein JWM80_3247 [Cyanobacteria bacterium RYN_339]|nr:hypothetical protein [Cyanobacteria bacterium RYN_339]
MRAAVACLCLLVLTGCASPRVPGLAFVMPAIEEPGPAPVATEPPARDLTTAVRDGAVRIFGSARLSQGLPAANVGTDGSVGGSPVTVTDVMTGRRVGLGTTFYDGSFYVDVPVAQGQRAVLVTLDLVDRRSSDRRTSLAAPALLKAGEGEHQLHVSLGTTVLAAFLSDVAALQAGRELSDTPLVSPVGGSRELGALIASFKADDQVKFEGLVASAPELANPASVEELGAGLRRYGDKLRASAKKKAL